MSGLDRFPRSVRVVEVGPRDGLQNEPDPLRLPVKLAFVRGLIAAGVRAIEVGAFVRPDRVPQMADTEALFRALAPGEGQELWALVPNLRGLDRAVACGVRHVALFSAASDAFSQANVGASVVDSLKMLRAVARRAADEGITLRGYVSTAFWCPFSGQTAPDGVRRVVLELLDCGCGEVSVADTIGAATPRQVSATLEALLEDVPASQIGVHFHDTRGTALANVLEALQLGLTTVDAAAGGLGGCPFAPGAQGNLATEDLLYMLDGMGIETGVDLSLLRKASLSLEPHLGRRLLSRYLRAGPPPSGEA